jgi:hypothetical protein
VEIAGCLLISMRIFETADVDVRMMTDELSGGVDRHLHFDDSFQPAKSFCLSYPHNTQILTANRRKMGYISSHLHNSELTGDLWP